ncbi:DUF4296 domain-containing protein [Asinibacterium sp. OR53]|uniref:DUF4296 domain-containing protein n=1 Tax=Asinibacterium sp. OR53 TaxID=925409 RepID=UPI00047930DD|nr:DUF4296 domain-containing protein [Asinibacterium sp. OR53]
MKKYGVMQLIGCLALLLAGCSDNKPKVIPVNTMKKVVWDMMKADELFARERLKDSTMQKKREDIRLYEQVFSIHHITREQFYQSYRYYETHPVQFKELLDSVESLSTKEQQQLSKKRAIP